MEILTTMLTEQDRLTLLHIARNAIARELGLAHEKMHHPASGNLAVSGGAFVTLHHHGQLRGCIGYIESPEPLADIVRSAAVKAAFQDPRFPHLTRSEFHGVLIEISVLTPPMHISDLNAIEVGRDGLIVELGFARGLLLPQVAVEQGWDRMRFVENTCAKAGLPRDAWMDPASRIFAFQADVFSENATEIALP
jgi:AmmeMemoRadiSam system protein A